MLTNQLAENLRSMIVATCIRAQLKDDVRKQLMLTNERNSLSLNIEPDHK